jgi:hypothetical protein
VRGGTRTCDCVARPDLVNIHLLALTHTRGPKLTRRGLLDPGFSKSLLAKRRPHPTRRPPTLLIVRSHGAGHAAAPG